MACTPETEHTGTCHRQLLERLGAAAGRVVARLRAAHYALLLALVARWRAWRMARGRAPGHGFVVEVLIADRRKARSIQRALQGGLCRLSRALGLDFLGADCTAAVVVQLAIIGEQPVAGTCHLWRDTEGRRRVLIRLALDFDASLPGIDYLLAILAEQVVLVATQHTGTTSLIFPVAHPFAHDVRDRTPTADPLSALVPIAVPAGASANGNPAAVPVPPAFRAP